MDVDLGRALGVLNERMLAQPCLDRRLQKVSDVVRKARRTGVLPNIGKIGFPPIRPLQTSGWDDAITSGALPHLDPDRRSFLSINMPLLKNYPGEVLQEFSAWSTLRMLESVPGPASDATLTEAASIIARLQVTSYLNGQNAAQIRADLVAHKTVPSYYLILDREGTLTDVRKMNGHNSTCDLTTLVAAGG